MDPDRIQIQIQYPRVSSPWSDPSQRHSTAPMAFTISTNRPANSRKNCLSSSSKERGILHVIAGVTPELLNSNPDVELLPLDDELLPLDAVYNVFCLTVVKC